MKSATLPRHGCGTRALHLANALVVIVLLVTGLALGDVLAERVVAVLGGHLRVNDTHRVLGLAFAAALVLVASFLPGRVSRLLRDTVYFRRGEWRWPLQFLRFCLSPGRHPAPFHDGRFDPAQRVVFCAIILSVVVVSATGVYLYWTPPLGRTVLGYAIRIHIAAAWLLIGCLCVHILAGSGLLRTHRGLVTAMFGDGRVPVPLARVLWPGWTQRQARGVRGDRPASDVDAGGDVRKNAE